jgi:hypothetical protein
MNKYIGHQKENHQFSDLMFKNKISRPTQLKLFASAETRSKLLRDIAKEDHSRMQKNLKKIKKIAN